MRKLAKQHRMDGDHSHADLNIWVAVRWMQQAEAMTRIAARSKDERTSSRGLAAAPTAFGPLAVSLARRRRTLLPTLGCNSYV